MRYQKKWINRFMIYQKFFVDILLLFNGMILNYLYFHFYDSRYIVRLSQFQKMLTVCLLALMFVFVYFVYFLSCVFSVNGVYCPQSEKRNQTKTYMGGYVMKLQNIQEVEEFRKVVHQCKGRVYLESLEGDIFNLKSAMSEYVALGRLLSEQGDSLELFADSKEDEALLLNFLGRLDEENRQLDK